MDIEAFPLVAIIPTPRRRKINTPPVKTLMYCYPPPPKSKFQITPVEHDNKQSYSSMVFLQYTCMQSFQVYDLTKILFRNSAPRLYYSGIMPVINFWKYASCSQISQTNDCIQYFILELCVDVILVWVDVYVLCLRNCDEFYGQICWIRDPISSGPMGTPTSLRLRNVVTTQLPIKLAILTIYTYLWRPLEDCSQNKKSCDITQLQ